MLSSRLTLSVAVVVSLLLHGGLVVLVAMGWQSESEQQRPPIRVVQARLVELNQTAPKQQAPKVDEKKPNVVDLTKKRQAEERRKERERQARLAEQKRKRELAEKKRAEEQKKKEAEEQRKRLEAERQKQALADELKQLEEQQRQSQLQKELAAAEAAEQAALAAEQAEATAQSYVAVIAERVEQYWSRPPSARKGMQCELLLQLVPTGRVINVTVVKSSGSAAFDRSAEQAVLKAEQFKELQQLSPEVFERYFRELRLVFNPRDLRL